jgi:hypothetical protein
MILATKSYCREYAEKISTGCEFLSGIGNNGQEFVGSPALLQGSKKSITIVTSSHIALLYLPQA